MTGGFGSYLRLEKLETLDLSENNLNKSSLKQLSALTSLKSLNLSGNNMGGELQETIPVQGMFNYFPRKSYKDEFRWWMRLV